MIYPDNGESIPSPSQVVREIEYLRMEERDTEQILRRGEMARRDKRRKILEWIGVGITILAVAFLTWKFSGTPSLPQ